MIRKPMKNGLAMLLMMSMVVTLCGCSVFWSEKHEIKNYETKAPETTGTSQEKEEKEMDWEDAVDLAADYLKTMTTEEKVGQLFVVNLEQVDGRKGNYYEFHTCTKTMQKNIEKYHVGGVILFSRNIANRKQTLKMTEGFQNTGRIPLFICVDEEGGSVARIGSNAKMETTSFPTAEEIGKTKDDTYTYQMGDRITVDYYGCPTPIQQMAAVSVPEPRILMIQPWDATTLKDIEKAILTSDIGINPQNDGRVIRLSFPPLTEERRKDIVKEVRKTAEENKVAIRNTRRDAIEKLKALKKANTITEDDVADGEKKIQNLTDKFCKEIDDLAALKEKEIMEI